MQSDFVAAVSHEFGRRSLPMRQLSEIWRWGAYLSRAAANVYDTLVHETSRLQRLVEALLNFGRMEAARACTISKKWIPSDLVHRVVAEFETQAAVQGRHIRMEGSDEACAIEADPKPSRWRCGTSWTRHQVLARTATVWLSGAWKSST